MHACTKCIPDARTHARSLHARTHTVRMAYVLACARARNGLAWLVACCTSSRTATSSTLWPAAWRVGGTAGRCRAPCRHTDATCNAVAPQHHPAMRFSKVTLSVCHASLYFHPVAWILPARPKICR